MESFNYIVKNSVDLMPKLVPWKSPSKWPFKLAIRYSIKTKTTEGFISIFLQTNKFTKILCQKKSEFNENYLNVICKYDKLAKFCVFSCKKNE